MLWNNCATQVGRNPSLLFIFIAHCYESNRKFVKIFLRNLVTTLFSQRVIDSILGNASSAFSVLEILSSVDGWVFALSQKFEISNACKLLKYGAFLVRIFRYLENTDQKKAPYLDTFHTVTLEIVEKLFPHVSCK